MPLVSTVHYFWRETPNPIPICLCTMSHEQEETGSKAFWDHLWKKPLRTEIILNVLPRFLGTNDPGWREGGTSQGKAICSINNKQTARGKSAARRTRPCCPFKPQVVHSSLRRIFFLHTLWGEERWTPNASVQRHTRWVVQENHRSCNTLESSQLLVNF